MAVRRDPALAIGGFAEDMLTGEDVDFCYRLQRRFSCAIVYEPRALLFHRNHRTDTGLRRQAWTYGEGAAHVYLRYPETLRWDIRKSWRLAAVLAQRSVWPLGLRIKKWVGAATREQLEFAQYHRLWAWCYWAGFFGMYLSGRRRA
jgi:GT2 family glycosyltransferase